MAIDESLLNFQRASNALPALRFYSWDKPSVSIGYFQKIETIAQKFGADKKDITIVRRISGGGAVEHGEDLTFSLTLKTINPFFSTDVKSSYLRINEAIRVGLKEFYPELDYADCRTVPTAKPQSNERICFQTPACYDLLLSGKKILGASQRRIEKNLLHQSSMFLKKGREPLIHGILNGFEYLWKVKFEEKPLSKEEIMVAKKLERKRYALRDWSRSAPAPGLSA
jgi:lipoate-protein ligase A